MAKLSRIEVFTIASQLGWVKGTPLTQNQRIGIRSALRAALIRTDTPPTRVFQADGSFRPMTIDEATDNLLEELV